MSKFLGLITMFAEVTGGKPGEGALSAPPSWIGLGLIS